MTNGSNILKSERPAPRQRHPQTTQTGMVYLRVNQGSLMVLTPPTANQPNPQPLPPPNTAEVLNVIIASLPDMQTYAGHSVDRLTYAANLIHSTSQVALSTG